MTLGQIVHLARWAVAVGLLLAGLISALLALLLLREGIPRTEGSPAGALIAAVLIAAIAAAPVLLIAGAAVCFRLSRLPWPRPEARRSASSSPQTRRGEFWLEHDRGTRLGALFNAGRAVLVCDTGSGAPPLCSHGARPQGPALTHPFADAQERLLQLPYWVTLPEAFAQREQEHFRRTGERSGALDWVVLEAACEPRESLWDRVARVQPPRTSRAAHAPADSPAGLPD